MPFLKCKLAIVLQHCHSELFSGVVETFDFWIWITICDARLVRSCQNRLLFQSVIESSVTPDACFSWQKWKLSVSFVLWRNRFNQLSAVAYVVTAVSQLFPDVTTVNQPCPMTSQLYVSFGFFLSAVFQGLWCLHLYQGAGRGRGQRDQRRDLLQHCRGDRPVRRTSRLRGPYSHPPPSL